jgi:hypothetical protein
MRLFSSFLQFSSFQILLWFINSYSVCSLHKFKWKMLLRTLFIVTEKELSCFNCCMVRTVKVTSLSLGCLKQTKNTGQGVLPLWLSCWMRAEESTSEHGSYHDECFPELNMTYNGTSVIVNYTYHLPALWSLSIHDNVFDWQWYSFTLVFIYCTCWLRW